MKKRFFLGNKLLFSGIIAGITLLITAFFSWVYPFAEILSYSNLGIRNILFSMSVSLEEHRKNPNITLVAIDDKTLADTEEGGLGRWQDFKRDYYAKVIENLNKHGAVAIGIDVLFSEKSENDTVLISELKKSGNVILGMSLPPQWSKESAIFPTPLLRESARMIGYFQPILNPVNNLVYSISPIEQYKDGTWYEPFSLAVLRYYLDTTKWVTTLAGKDAKKYVGSLQFHTGDYEKIILSGINDEVLINYLPRGSAFQTISFVDIYNDRFDEKLVKDKMIFIGSTATALHDEFFTPRGILPGVLLHLNLINTILTNSYLSYVSPGIELSIIILLALLLTTFLMHVNSRVYQLIYAFLVFSIGGFSYIFLYAFTSKIFLHPTEIVMVVMLSAILVTSYKYIYEEKWKRLLKNTLSQYLAEDLVTAVLSNYEEVKLGGSRKEVTLFFSDIAGFTTISEKMSPEELVKFLSVYLKEVSDIIIHERGFVNKYEWDAVMAIWWAFGLEDQQSFLACKSALLQQEAITRMNQVFKDQFGFEISVRMWLNKWPAVVGNIGSEGKKIEYTALWDTVNTASRFEGINKMYGTLICVGQSIYENEKDVFVFRKLDSIMVKGKDLPVLIYELIGEKERVSLDIIKKNRKFEDAFILYQARKFKEAKTVFDELIALYDDGPSKTFSLRAEEYIKNGCPDDWQGHYRATEK